MPSTTPDRTIDPIQVRGARGVLGWSLVDLAKAAGVSVSTVKRFEDAERSRPSSRTTEAIRTAFEAHGIEFEVAEDGRLGLRFDPSIRSRASVFTRFM